MCHSKNAKPPFYANFPIAGSLVKADMQMGLRSYDITDTVDAIKTGAKVSSTDLAKIEYAVDDGRCRRCASRYSIGRAIFPPRSARLSQTG